MRVMYEIELPDAKRHPEDTDDDYDEFNNGWQYDLLGDLLALADDLGIKMNRL